MPAFMTHPSVRIKGTENNYEPILCEHTNCPKHDDHATHSHCPFCVKTETFLDPVILKAHYLVKHVDKGLDFAGLKILRCCDQCEVVGSIKGEKKFKVPHWHCYRCRNGFNRRDEAIKHFRTHFRTHQTTFQIQVVEEVNVMLNNFDCPEETVAFLDGNGSHMLYDQDTPILADNSHNEVVETEPEPVLLEDQRTQSSEGDLTGDSFQCHLQKPSYEELLKENLKFKERMATLQSKLRSMENRTNENFTLKLENEKLRNQVLALSLSAQLDKSENDIKIADSDRIDQLIDELQQKHKELLDEQLLQLRTGGCVSGTKRECILMDSSRDPTPTYSSHEHPCKIIKTKAV